MKREFIEWHWLLFDSRFPRKGYRLRVPYKHYGNKVTLQRPDRGKMTRMRISWRVANDLREGKD